MEYTINPDVFSALRMQQIVTQLSQIESIIDSLCDNQYVHSQLFNSLSTFKMVLQEEQKSLLEGIT